MGGRVRIFALVLALRAAPGAAQEPVTAEPDPATGRIELPDPGPRPSYPQAHLWRPLALPSWHVELAADARLGMDVGTEAQPVDAVVGFALGLVENLQASAAIELRAAGAAGATGADVVHATQVGGTYAVYSLGTGALTVAGSLDLWIPIQAGGDLVLIPTIHGVWRIVDSFGVRAALSIPFTLTSEPRETLSVLLRPEVQPLDWLWLSVGSGVALANSEDLIVPLDFELGFTPWGPIDILARFAFPDLQSIGLDHRELTAGLRGRF